MLVYNNNNDNNSNVVGYICYQLFLIDLFIHLFSHITNNIANIINFIIMSLNDLLLLTTSISQADQSSGAHW